ncbi:N-acetylglucosamine kinase-like BadF-type ATPase [Kibdelosporangium banguiense]|uniref:N-acetylglucosamine kinase-like BadF-type ATPase n=1 Tax=Kibdelosporangium banguiense TaxID=1365924 RepID=A0ABS4U1G4_9PSEU|nr:BadF/BadG/BcrA/BcrD ATPase family protein [Kibdelosporangium banguiense]MBP2330499.1 N-acetylglucosamine kinase-like BadF-type ATPase [Kibdelosporangium banguiense]
MPELISGVRVGIDVGGTKTHIHATRGGETIADRVVASEGWLPSDGPAAAAFLAELIGTTVRQAGVDGIVVGAHGCDSARACAVVQEELTRLLPVACLVCNDAELLVPAAGLAVGVGLVAGTGSVAVGRDRQGESVYVGGWGWLLGDEGSASGLTREAARASLAARNRGEPPDLLADLLVRSYQVTEVTDLPDAMAADLGAAGWGSRASLVFDALNGGSALAEAVVREAAEALAGLVAMLATRDVPVDDVVVAGGVILNQRRLFDAFLRELAVVAPSSKVHRLAVPPVHGAVRLAEQLK